MARHTPECDAMIEACAAAGQKLFVAYYRRALPRFLKIRDLLESRAVGRVTGIACRFAQRLPVNRDRARGGWRLAAADSGGGLLLDLGSHAIDLLDFFWGPLPLDRIHAHAAQLTEDGETEDAVAVTFLTPAGVPGTAAWNFGSHVAEDRIEIAGTRGRISCSVFGHEPVQLEGPHGTEWFEFPAPAHVGQGLIQTVVDDLLGRGTCPSTGTSARRASQVMDRILHAYYGGRDDAFWNRPETWPGRTGIRPPAP
jgi:predicted dehydrogenase